MVVEWIVSTTDGVTIIRLKGEIDLLHSPDLRALLQTQLKNQVAALLVDFTEVSYIDSSGLATLVEYYQKSQPYGGRVALAGLSPRVRSIFGLVRLNEIFPIFETAALARAELLRTGAAGLSAG